MEHKSIDDLVQQRMLFVEENTDEEGIRSRVLHIGEANEGRRGMQKWYLDFCQDRRYNGSFL